MTHNLYFLANIHARSNHERNTPLHIAAQRGIKMISMMIMKMRMMVMRRRRMMMMFYCTDNTDDDDAFNQHHD